MKPITPVQSQKGVVLMLGLILLVILTIVGFSSMKVSGTQQKTAVNHDNKAISIQAAEFGLSVVTQKIATGCSTALTCDFKIYAAPTSSKPDSNLTQVPNSNRAFWALNSEISKDSSTGEVTVEIVGAAKDSLNGTEGAISIFRATFQTKIESVSIWAGNKIEFLSDHSNSLLTVNGELQSFGDILIKARALNVTSGKQGGSISCTYCTADQFKLFKKESVPAPPTAASLIPGSSNSSNCSDPTRWENNTTIICNDSVKFSNSVFKTLTNFKMLVKSTIEIQKNFQLFGSGNLIASTGDIKFLSSGNQTHEGIFHADNSIDMTSSGAAGVVITGAMTARNDVKIDARTLTLNIPSGGGGGAASSTAFKILRWQQVS